MFESSLILNTSNINSGLLRHRVEHRLRLLKFLAECQRCFLHFFLKKFAEMCGILKAELPRDFFDCWNWF